MPIAQSIGSRIFGLALLLVGLMIVLAVFLLFQVTALNDRLQAIEGYYAPLEQHLVRLNEAGLRRRLAFERWQGAIGSHQDRAAAVTEASRNYGLFTAEIRKEIEWVRGALAHPVPDEGAQAPLRQIGSLVDQIASNHELMSTRQQEVLALRERGDAVPAASILGVLDDIQAILQKQRREVQDTITAVMAAEMREANRRHARIVWTTAIATLASALLGIVAAALVTRRLVRPVRSLISGIRSVEGGDLSVQLPVATADEIGTLTRSFNYFVSELRHKESLRSTFGKYIDPRVLSQVLEDRDAAGPAGGRRAMTVSFCDLERFSALSEQLTPAGVVNFLNRHFTHQAGAIQRYQGVVDKYMGDAVMAFWGPPFTDGENDAVLACRAALAQSRAMDLLRDELPEITGLRKNLPHVEAGVGISTGEVVAGSIGSENARNYTVIGDTVNLASRLEKANRTYGTRILLCGTTRDAAGAAIVAREIDSVVAKGKSEATRVYELVGLAGEVPDGALALCERTAEALAAYRARDWDAAERAFRECLALDAADRCSRLFLERIAAFRLSPPPAGWNGTWVFAGS